MRICFVVQELFNWGFYGGFGFLTREIGRELVKRGIEVSVVMPQSSMDQELITILDGMEVLSFPTDKPGGWRGLSNNSQTVFEMSHADIYHSQGVSLGTLAVIKVQPKKKHIITFQDPRALNDYWSIWKELHKSVIYKGAETLRYMINKMKISSAVQKSDALYCQAKYTIPQVMSTYSLKKPPGFLPNPVEITGDKIKKAEEPTVCFLGRLDPIKRPEIFFELAKKSPNVRFLTLGRAHNKKRDNYLRQKYAEIPNLEFVGLVTGKAKSELLGQSWVLVNTSVYECLPIAFLEAAAHKCAILSYRNPDEFARNFGYHVENDDLKEYVKGMEFLFRDEKWKQKGEEAYRYVNKVHEKSKVIDLHIKIYEKLLEGKIVSSE